MTYVSSSFACSRMFTAYKPEEEAVCVAVMASRVVPVALLGALVVCVSSSVYDSPAFLQQSVDVRFRRELAEATAESRGSQLDALSVRWDSGWSVVGTLLPDCNEPVWGVSRDLPSKVLAVWLSDGNRVIFNEAHIERLSSTDLGLWVSVHEQLHACGAGMRDEAEIEAMARKWWKVDMPADASSADLPSFQGGHLVLPASLLGVRSLNEVMRDTIGQNPWLSGFTVKTCSESAAPLLCDPDADTPCSESHSDWRCRRPSANLPYTCGAEVTQGDGSMSNLSYGFLIASLVEVLVALLLYEPLCL